MTQSSSVDMKSYPILAQIESPQDLRALEESHLIQLAEELRQFLIEVTSRSGGHLAPGLGTIELTIALHRVFEAPKDKIVWDIGHQAYPHKLLTGRRDNFHTIRQKDGLSGFLKRSESEYDAFGAGHASTSISAALGMAVASQIKGDDNDVVAVIGDGALTGGLAFEALNNAGDLDANLLVILNDNEMSISPNVGALSNYLARILSGDVYTSVREGSKTVLSTLPPVKEFARRWEEHIKGMVMPSTLFEELGFNYIGPVDGHDVHTLIKTLENMREMDGPRFLHVVTQKGKGFKPAEGDPCIYHGVPAFDQDTGKLVKKTSGVRTYTQVFSKWLCDMAAVDKKLVGITPAMREGSGLVEFSEKFPDRYYDVGIAEGHALTFAAGIACEAVKPVVAIYSTFLQRAYDQVIHDISIQNLDVTFAIDRAGLVGADGATHAGVYDYSFLRCVPHMVVMAPADEAECRDMLYTAYQHKGPASVRYPRGGGSGVAEREQMQLIEIGKAQMLRETSAQDKKVALLAFGTMVSVANVVAERLDVTVVNMRFVKPLDEALICEIAKTHDLLVTIEENVVMGGAGSGVSEVLVSHGLFVPIMHLGVPDEHLDHGTQQEQLEMCGLDADSIEKRINAFLAQ